MPTEIEIVLENKIERFRKKVSSSILQKDILMKHAEALFFTMIFFNRNILETCK